MGGIESGIQFEEACNIDKEKIRAALKSRVILRGRTKKEARVTKAEADEIILRTYDDAVNTAVDALHCARALEKILRDHGWTYNGEEYRQALSSTQRQKIYFNERDRRTMLYVVK